MKRLVITICASASFYKHAVSLRADLENMGYDVLLPKVAEDMEAAGTYELNGFKPEIGDRQRKRPLITGHFQKVEQGDVCLVVNDDKPDSKNYIGGNVLMEMAVAYYLGKPIILLNDFPKNSILLDEILAITDSTLLGKIENLPTALAALDSPSM